MVVDLNFLKVIKFLLSIFFFSLIYSNSFSADFSFKKIAELEDPWGSSFINNDEIIVTEKGGKIKIVNVISEEVLEVKHNLNFLVYGQGGLLDIIYQNNNINSLTSEDYDNMDELDKLIDSDYDEKYCLKIWSNDIDIDYQGYKYYITDNVNCLKHNMFSLTQQLKELHYWFNHYNNTLSSL